MVSMDRDLNATSIVFRKDKRTDRETKNRFSTKLWSEIF